MSKSILVNCSQGKEDATLSDQKAIVLLTIEGVWIATKEYAKDIKKEGFPPLQEVLESFLTNGGEIWTCGTCTKPRGITEDDLIEGAKVVTAANLVEALVDGTISYTV